MADFDNIPIEVSAEDLENVAKRPYKIVARPPTGLDTGETGQWWIEIDNETEEVVQIYQRVGFNWVSYLNADTKIAGLNLKDEISVEDLLTALDVYPLIIGSDPPTTSTKGYNKQMYFDIENATFHVCRGLIGSGYLWEKAFTSGGGGGNIDLSDYVPKTRKIADIDLKDDITVKELQEKLSFDTKFNFTHIESESEFKSGENDFLVNNDCIVSVGGGASEHSIGFLFKPPSLLGNSEQFFQYEIKATGMETYFEYRRGRITDAGAIKWEEWHTMTTSSVPHYEFYFISQLFGSPYEITLTNHKRIILATYATTQKDEISGTELPAGDYLFLCTWGDTKVSCWSLTENALYSVQKLYTDNGTEYYKVSTANYATKSYLDEKIGDINTALDELHAYAQGLITGGVTE